MSIPSSAVQEAYIVSKYMKQKFPHVLLQVRGDMERPETPDVEIQHPLSWSVEFAMEVDLALDVIARAFHNQGIVSCYSRVTRIEFQILISSFNPMGCEAIH